MKPLALPCAALVCLAAAPGLAQTAADMQDAQVIQLLLGDGADLSKPHDIDFFLVLPDRLRANAAAVDMARLGYVVLAVERHGRDWEVRATRRMAPQLDAIKATTRELDALAALHEGYYDGWDTFAVR